MSLFAMRGSMAYYGQRNGWQSWFANDIWAFFLGGLVPTVIYSVITTFGFRTLVFKAHGDIRSIKYGLHYTVIAANILLFGLKFIYIAAPLYASLLNIILDPTVTVLFVSLYMWYVFKQNYVDRSRFRIVLTQVLGAFIMIYGLLAIVNLIMAAV